MPFPLYDPDLFEKLEHGAELDGMWQDGPTVFKTVVARTYEQISSSFQVRISLSFDRLGEAHSYWLRDINRVYEDKHAVPDHLKRAGFLAYWLRRRQVVHHILDIEGTSADIAGRDKFLINHNEFCAFVLGLRICHYFSLAEKLRADPDISDFLSSQNLDFDFLVDVSTLMKNKNVSPHSLYLIYRACFIDIQRPARSRPAEVMRFPVP
jgi:hypothetical protein